MSKIARTRTARGLWIAAGWVCIALGVIGAFLPVMPTTPFIILAAFCFSKGSERLYAWIVSHKTWGRMIQNWEEHRVIPVKAKVIALSMMALGGTVSFFSIPAAKPHIRIIAVSFMAAGALFVLAQKSRVTPPTDAKSRSSRAD